jgi:FixJ family two-component response regulator
MAALSQENTYSFSSVVYIIDDDDLILWTLKELLTSIGAEVKAFTSAKEFLDSYRPTPCECVISDIRMPEISGLQIQRTLIAQGFPPPIIFITSYSEISAAVETMKHGAFDFIEKPINGHVLLEKVQAALLKSRELHTQRMASKTKDARLSLLTPKERKIIDRVIQGFSSKDISAALSISIRTVENHRSRIMEKLHVNSTVELVKLFL